MFYPIFTPAKHPYRLNIKALFYNFFIDPLLSGLKQSVAEKITPESTVIDIACGTGSLAAVIAHKARHVTGIDLDADLIRFASRNSEKRGIANVKFQVKDASGLYEYSDKQFDVAVTSMAVHQFSEKLAVQILEEMKRISSRVIIADYSCPLPAGFYGTLAYTIERLAKGDHYRNFMNYMSRGGLKWFTGSAGLSIKSSTFRGYGVFVISECE